MNNFHPEGPREKGPGFMEKGWASREKGRAQKCPKVAKMTPKVLLKVENLSPEGPNGYQNVQNLSNRGPKLGKFGAKSCVIQEGPPPSVFFPTGCKVVPRSHQKVR